MKKFKLLIVIILFFLNVIIPSIAKDFSSNKVNEISKNLVSELVKRNKDLPPSEILKITTMAGCSAVNK